MEKLLSRAAQGLLLLMVIAAVALLFAMPVIGPLLFTDTVPERFRFENLPLWLQVPIGCFLGLYFLLELWAFWKFGFGTKSNGPVNHDRTGRGQLPGGESKGS